MDEKLLAYWLRTDFRKDILIRLLKKFDFETLLKNYSIIIEQEDDDTVFAINRLFDILNLHEFTD